MRLSAVVLAAVALSLPVLPAQAQAPQDRYDPPTQAASTAHALRGSQTALLSWSGKVAEPLRGAEDESDALRGSVPLDTATGRAMRGSTNEHFASVASVPVPARRPPAQRIASAPINPAPVGPGRLPTSLYNSGAAASSRPVAAAPPTPVAQARPAPLVPAPAAQAAPQVQPAQARTTQPQPEATLAHAQGESRPRFYSLHREYGLTPDPVPPAQPSILALSPAVATAMLNSKDDGPTIDLAGQDQAQVAAPPRLRNPVTGQVSNSTSTTSPDGTTSTTYNFRQP